METPGRSCSFWCWRWWAAEPGGISRSTAPKQQRAAETEEDYGDELETYDDTPPWDEEDKDETEGDK